MARITTALVLIVLLGGSLLYGPPWFFGIMVLVAVACALYELNRFIFPGDRWARIAGCGFGVAVAAAHQWPDAGIPVAPVLVAGCFVVAILHMLRSTTLERYLHRVGGTCFGVVYVALGLAYFSWLRAADHGRTLVTMTIAMAALSDTFAFAVGRTIGRRRLAPLISPNKTVEGVIAGFGGSVVAVLICRMWLWPALPVWPLIGLGLVIGAVAPLGDLIESSIKRAYHAKDSGGLLPGHGGMLDRADAYIFSAPAVYYYMKYVMGVI